MDRLHKHLVEMNHTRSGDITYDCGDISCRNEYIIHTAFLKYEYFKCYSSGETDIFIYEAHIPKASFDDIYTFSVFLSFLINVFPLVV